MNPRALIDVEFHTRFLFFILSYLVCIYLISNLMPFLFFPSNWHNLLWRYVHVWLWHNFHCAYFMCLTLVVSHFISCWADFTFLIPAQGHTMPRSEDKVQKQFKAVFGYLWQIHGVCTVLDVIITIEFYNWGAHDHWWCFRRSKCLLSA